MHKCPFIKVMQGFKESIEDEIATLEALVSIGRHMLGGEEGYREDMKRLKARQEKRQDVERMIELWESCTGAKKGDIWNRLK